MDLTFIVTLSATMTAEDIINGLGGTSAVAENCGGLTPSTVSSWKTNNSIPAWRQPALLAMAAENDFALTAADFPSRRKAAAA